MGQEVVLVPDDVALCCRLGEERQANNERAGVREAKYSRRSGKDIHIQGVLGEMAVRKWFDLPMDTLLDTRSCNAHNDRGDLVVPLKDDQAIIDIKTFVHSHVTHLHVTSSKRTRHHIQVFAAVRLERDASLGCDEAFSPTETIRAHLLGFVHRDFVFQHCHQDNRIYKVPLDALTTLERAAQYIAPTCF